MSALRFEHLIIDPHGPLDPHIKVVGDVDGDGHPDIVVPSSKEGPLVWYRYPDWSRHEIAPSGRWSCDAKLVDMDGDGDHDLLISEWYTENRMEWYENPLPHGDPAVDPWTRHLIGAPRAHDIEVADLDGDGHPEIVTRTQGDDGDHIVIRKQNASGAWDQRVLSCPAGEGLAVGDIDRDGLPDIVIPGQWFRTPVDVLAGNWETHRFTDWSPDAVIQIADLTGDGGPDVLLTRSEGCYRLSWFDVPPDPVNDPWVEHVVDPDVDYAHSLVICDVNDDGLLDIVTAEMHQSERKRVLVYLNGGDARSWSPNVIATTGSHKLCAADLGNTGTVDLIGVNWSGPYQPVEIWKQVTA